MLKVKRINYCPTRLEVIKRTLSRYPKKLLRLENNTIHIDGDAKFHQFVRLPSKSMKKIMYGHIQIRSKDAIFHSEDMQPIYGVDKPTKKELKEGFWFTEDYDNNRIAEYRIME